MTETYEIAGMLHVGMGETHLNEWLSVMNVPPLARLTVKMREQEVGPSIEAVAEETCQRAMQAEMSATEESQRALLAHQMPIPLVASYDMGWTRRGSA